jgi:hypothetical protein
MKIHTKVSVAIIICFAVSVVGLGFFKQKLVTANENAYSSDTLTEAKGTVRRYIFDSLKSECQLLDGDYELVDYHFESFRWERPEFGGWESFASARGICDDMPEKARRLVIASEDSYSGDTRAEAEADVRQYVTDSLKSECQLLDGDYELADYGFQFFECGKDESGGWACYADAKGVCKKQ